MIAARIPGLTPVRAAIDGVDDGMVLLLAARARLARLAGRLKSQAGARGRDPGREREVRERAAALAAWVGVAPRGRQRGGRARHRRGLPCSGTRS